MDDLQRVRTLNQMLLDDMPQYREQAAAAPADFEGQWRLFRSLVNVREPRPIGGDFLALQDSLLQSMSARRGVTDLASLAPVGEGLYLWKGDITTLRTDGIVNAANSGMTGCYSPCHGCIDNAIHTFAGVQLRLECAELMKAQGHPEPAGGAKITKAYNLPCRFVLHTVGPIVSGRLSQEDCRLLASCYRSCLLLAQERGLRSIAFCCISTGEFRFPNREAAEIAVNTVRQHLSGSRGMQVVFNVFLEKDHQIYRQLLQG